MMSNRGWLLKVVLPVLVFAVLCTDAATRLSHAYPTLRKCLANPTTYDGRTLWCQPRLVVGHRSDGFSVLDARRHIPILSPARPPIGSYVSFRGTFRSPDRIIAPAVRFNTHFELERRTAYILSAAVLLIWMPFFFRRFRLGWRGGLIHPRIPKA